MHPEAVGIDLCESCGEPLRDTTRSLLRLTSVKTARRDRISSDEEERRRAGFELQTSYRFGHHGGRSGRIDATAADSAGSLLGLRYGDSATVRVTNVGQRRRQRPDLLGYMLDITTGRWLKETEREDQAVPEEEGLDLPEGTRRKQRVIPFVEDRRNILVTRLEHPVSLETAITAMTALERGIEAAFQLEDSELSSETLPDLDGQGRALFVESAEGGAGVLRRLVDDPSALAQAARTALDILHFDPASGEDRAVAATPSGEEPCVRACYDCLLSYGNQGVHDKIDRHLVKDILMRLSTSTVVRTDGARPGAPAAAENPQSDSEDTGSAGPPESSHPSAPRSEAARDFIAWLAAQGLRLPDEVDATAEGARPDLIYRLPDGNAAVFFTVNGDGRDERALDDLRDLGWSVITIGATADWAAIAGRYPSIFGSR